MNSEHILNHYTGGPARSEHLPSDQRIERVSVSGMRRYRLILGFAASLCVALVCGCFPAFSLAAEEEHPYLASHSIIDQITEASACGVVTDSHGDVYVPNYSKQLVAVYSPGAVKLAEFKVSFTNGPCSLAVDSAGAVYVEEYAGQVDKYKPSAFPPASGTTYALEASAGTKGVIVAKSAKAHAIAVDPANQDLYVASASHVSSYEPDGKLISATIGEGLVPEASYYGVDVYGANGDVYLTDTAHGRVYILNPSGTEILKEVTGTGTPARMFERGRILDNLAIDQSSGDFYVYYGDNFGSGAAYEFNAAGGYLSKIGPEFDGGLGVEMFEGADVAVDNGSSSPNAGDVYLTSEDRAHEADSVYAFGPASEHTLKVDNEDAGAGTVTSEPAGIECGATCEAKFSEGETIVLKAERKEGFVFAGWSGACAGSEGTCEVAMSEERNVTAKWRPAGHLALKLEKSGEGTVTSEPSGIECGATCEATFEEDGQVTLKAVEEPGSKFAGWTGCTPLANPKECSVTMSEARTVTAAFETATGSHPLQVEESGTGKGTVTSEPSGIECGATCEATFEEDGQVTLKAVEEPGSKFAGWTGCTPLANPKECSVTMSEARTVTAAFNTATQFNLEVNTAGTGAGSVVSHPVGIDCPSASCDADFEEGIDVTLEAKPGFAGGFVSTFAGWSGACAGAQTTCVVTMSQAQTVTATFVRGAPLYALDVLDAGVGEGTVSSAQLGVECGGLVCAGPIDCGSLCEASFEAGMMVELVAVPAWGSVFAGWSGACSGKGVCDVTVSEARSVIATFEPIVAVEYVLTVGKSGGGAGSVMSAPGGINCGSVCAASFKGGAAVELKAVADAGYTFAGWSGACAGTAACEVTMDQARTVTAMFVVSKSPLPPLETQGGPSTSTGATSSAGTGSTHVPPPPPSAGTLTTPGVGAVAGAGARLRLRCSTAGPCDGQLKLTISLRQGHRTEALVIGKASYSIPAGASRTIVIALSSRARAILRRHRSLRATLAGAGVHHTLELRAPRER